MSQAFEIAVVGLGVGSLAAYATARQHWTFYEIDPADERIARNRMFFTYLSDCGQRCRVVIGDARLSLTNAEPAQYGLIVLDAFSSRTEELAAGRDSSDWVVVARDPADLRPLARDPHSAIPQVSQSTPV